MVRTLVLIFGVSCLLLAKDDPKQNDEPRKKVRIEHTEKVDFPAGGLLRLKNSTGELVVEGWDRPDIEITTVKSTNITLAPREYEKASREMEEVRIAAQRQGEELIITTDIPHRRSISRILDLEYRIKVPMNAKLAVDHGSGEVHVYNLTSDIHVVVHKGGITLGLPENGRYRIDAKSEVGSVTSDFPGHETRTRLLFGHTFGYQPGQEAADAHNLYLKVGFGDITILKLQRPPAPTQ